MSFRLFVFISSFYVADQASLLTCVSPDTAGPLLTCPSATLVWIDRAYLARTRDATASSSSFCDFPAVDVTRDDCTSSADDVTNDVNAKCAFYETCRVNVDYSLLNCSAVYSGPVYLRAEYECMATQVSGVNLPTMIISLRQTLTNQPGIAYFRSADFPSFWTTQRGACRIDVPPGRPARVTWRILDLRGRLINRESGCSYLFAVYTGTFYRSWCARLQWTEEPPDNCSSSSSISFVFEPKYAENSEGMMFVNLNLTNENGEPINGINITCGKDLALDQPPITATIPTFTSSSTSLLSPSPAKTIMTTNTISSTAATNISGPSTDMSFPTAAIGNETTFISSTYVKVSSSEGTTTPVPSPGAPLFPWNQSTGETDDANGSHASLIPFLGNRTEVATSAATDSNLSDQTVWLIIGLTVGSGLLLIIVIIIIIATLGYKKRLRAAQRQNEVLFAWERAPGAAPAPAAAASAKRNKDAPTPTANNGKPNTYCLEPKSDIYLEIAPPQSNENWSYRRSPTTGDAAAQVDKGGAFEEANATDCYGSRATTMKSFDSQINPVYGQLPLTDYFLAINGLETTASI